MGVRSLTQLMFCSFVHAFSTKVTESEDMFQRKVVFVFAMKECLIDAKYANSIILKACDEDRDGMGKKAYEIYNKGNHAIYYFITGKINEEYSLRSIIKNL